MRKSALCAFGLVVAILVALGFLLIRSHPADVGLSPYGSWDSVEHRGYDDHGRTLQQKHWLLLLPMLLCTGAFTSVGYSHLTVLARGEGFAPQTIALAITISGLTLMASKFTYGFVEEKLSAYATNWIFGGILTAGLLLCCVTGGSTARLYIAMIVYGFGLPLGTVGITTWAGDLASPEQFDMTVRRFQAGYAAGALVFSSLPGILADRFDGSYVPAYLFFAVCAVFAVNVIQWMYRNTDKG
mgnify:CR=1 FL=1